MSELFEFQRANWEEYGHPMFHVKEPGMVRGPSTTDWGAVVWSEELHRYVFEPYEMRIGLSRPALCEIVGFMAKLEETPDGS